MKKETPLYKQRVKKLKRPEEEISSEPMVLREVATLPGIGPIISVRAAKAHLSALLELVAAGREITITSDGEPKAKLVKAEPQKRGKIFTGMGDYLTKQPIHRGPSAEEIIREDRDARGW